MRRGLWLLGLWACGGEAEPTVDPATLLAPGPHPVGYRLTEVNYLPPLSATPRRLAVHVWYPAAAKGEDRPIYVVRKSEVATVDAAPAELGPLPAVLYSHGHQAYATVMSQVMEHLASHGYLVIAPTHSGNTFLDGDDRQTDIYYQRPLDLSATLDHFQTLQDDPLAGRLSDRIAISGHSFGGYTAFALGGAQYPVDALDAGCVAGTTSAGYCSTLDAESRALFRAGFYDPRFFAILSYDPGDFGLFGGPGVAQVEAPVLQVVAEGSGFAPGDPSSDPYWVALHGAQDLHLLLRGGEHNDFTDSCGSGVTIRCSTLVPAEVLKPLAGYSLAFLERALRGRSDLGPILDGTTAVSPLYQATKR